MASSARNRIYMVLFVLFAAVCVSQAASSPAVPQPAGAGQDLLNRSLLKDAGLVHQWQSKLTLKPGETITSLYVINDLLYALTTRNILYGIDRHTGKTRFVEYLAVENLPISEPKAFEKWVVFLVGSQYVAVDSEAGVVSRRAQMRHIGNGARCGIARNSKYAYLSSSDRRVHVLDVEKLIDLFSVRSDDNALIHSVIATEDVVVMATQSGIVIGMYPDKPTRMWQFNTTGTMSADLSLDDKHVYVSGEDTKLYKLDIMTGKNAWPTPFFAGYALKEKVIIGKKTVYQTVPLGGLYAVDKETGKSRWHVKNGQATLAEDGDKTYLLINPGILTVVDNAAGKELTSINAAGINISAVNMLDGKLYLGNTDGQIQCVTPPQADNSSR